MEVFGYLLQRLCVYVAAKVNSTGLMITEFYEHALKIPSLGEEKGCPLKTFSKIEVKTIKVGQYRMLRQFLGVHIQE